MSTEFDRRRFIEAIRHCSGRRHRHSRGQSITRGSANCRSSGEITRALPAPAYAF